MAATNKQYVVYALKKNASFPTGSGSITMDVIQVVGFYGNLSNAQDAAQEADNNQNDDVWIVNVEQHRV